MLSEGKIEELEKKLQELTKEIDRQKEIDRRVVDFVDVRLEREKDRAEFWKEMRIRVASSGIWGVILLLCIVVWYAIKTYFLHRGP